MESCLTKSTIVINTILCVIKLIGGTLYNSVSLISDAFNSLTDIVSSTLIHMSIKISKKKADRDHPFGHSRFQPVAALIVAILMCVLGFEIVVAGIMRLINREVLVKGILPLIIVLIVVISKAVLYFWTKHTHKKTKSVALKAALLDHRNDVLIGFTVFSGIYLSNLGYYFFDGLIAVLLGGYIFMEGFDLAKENYDSSTGKAPKENYFEDIANAAESIQGVIEAHHIRAQMLGTEIYVETHISVNPKISIKEAHDIAEKVGKKIELIPGVGRAFVHTDPYEGKVFSKRRY